MKIKQLFDDCEEITIESYLEKCGVSNPTQYMKAKTVEETTNYDNIDEARDLILKYVKGGDVGVK